MRGPWKSPSLICNLDFHHEMSLNLHTWLLVNETVLSRLGANEDTVSQVESLLCARQSHRMKIFQVFHPKKEKKIPFFVSALTSCLSPTPTPSKVSWAPLVFVLCECVRVKSGKPALYCWTGEDTHTHGDVAVLSHITSSEITAADCREWAVTNLQNSHSKKARTVKQKKRKWRKC